MPNFEGNLYQYKFKNLNILMFLNKMLIAISLKSKSSYLTFNKNYRKLDFVFLGSTDEVVY